MPIRQFFQTAVTFVLVAIGWIIFRSENMTQAVDFLHCMVSNPVLGDKYFLKYILYAVLLLSVEWIQRDKQHALQLPDKGVFRYTCVRWALYYLIIGVIFYNMGEQQTFIYFQF